MRVTPETYDAIRTALMNKPGSTVVEISSVIGCGMRESYDPLMRMLARGEVSRVQIPVEGKRPCWVYSLELGWVNVPTPPPYPNILLAGEWVSDMFKLMNLNRR